MRDYARSNNQYINLFANEIVPKIEQSSRVDPGGIQGQNLPKDSSVETRNLFIDFLSSCKIRTLLLIDTIRGKNLLKIYDASKMRISCRERLLSLRFGICGIHKRVR